MNDVLDGIISWENGELDHESTVEFFQKLLDTGYINHLQGSYQRVARDLIESGQIGLGSFEMAKKEKYAGLSKDQKEELIALAYDWKPAFKSLENAIKSYNKALLFELRKLEKAEEVYQDLIDRANSLVEEVTENAREGGAEDFADEWDDVDYYGWGGSNGVFGDQERHEEISFIDLGLVNGEFFSDLPTEFGEED